MLTLTLLTIFLASFSTTESGCPSTCICSNSSVICSEKNLECVPNFDSLTNTPLYIDLSGNQINDINNLDFTFDASSDVKEIYLNNSQVTSIDSKAFDEMVNLQELYLQENLLNEIPEELFQKLNNLILLDLSNNLFFGGFPKIKSSSLEILGLVNSKITEISIDSLQSLPNLRTLLLQENSIKYISPSVFLGLNKFSYIHLAHNTWNCNCKTMEMLHFLYSKNYIDPREAIWCLDEEKIFRDISNSTALVNFQNKCKENDVLPWDSAKSYSLIKASTETNESKFRDEEHKEAEEPPRPQLNCTSNHPHESNNESFRLYFWEIIFVLVAFLIGVICGGSGIYFCGKCKKNLETSDSTTKLLV